MDCLDEVNDVVGAVHEEAGGYSVLRIGYIKLGKQSFKWQGVIAFCGLDISILDAVQIEAGGDSVLRIRYVFNML